MARSGSLCCVADAEGDSKRRAHGRVTPFYERGFLLLNSGVNRGRGGRREKAEKAESHRKWEASLVANVTKPGRKKREVSERALCWVLRVCVPTDVM
jgi:hypothetical protein|eukprot:COSAG06_NODE_2216_length_7324_cov_21.971626_6_plen_97_part_00